MVMVMFMLQTNKTHLWAQKAKRTAHPVERYAYCDQVVNGVAKLIILKKLCHFFPFFRSIAEFL